MYKQPLDLDPFFLLVTEIVTALSFFDLLIELVDNNRDEQVHDKESSHENVHNVEQTC